MHVSAESAVLAAGQGPKVTSKPTAVHLVTLGCARNEVDSEELAALLERDGFTLVADPAYGGRGDGQHLRFHRGGQEGLD